MLSEMTNTSFIQPQERTCETSPRGCSDTVCTCKCPLAQMSVLLLPMLRPIMHCTAGTILMAVRRTGLANSESCEGSKISVFSRQDTMD